MISITVDGVAYEVPSSAADTNWAAQQVAFEQALAAAVNPPTWVDAVYTNSWATSFLGQKAQHCLHADGFVELRGAIHAGASGTSALTLPAGCRPPLQAAFVIFASGGPAFCVVNTDGTVVLTDNGASAVTTVASLFGIRFSTTS